MAISYSYGTLYKAVKVGASCPFGIEQSIVVSQSYIIIIMIVSITTRMHIALNMQWYTCTMQASYYVASRASVLSVACNTKETQEAYSIAFLL